MLRSLILLVLPLSALFTIAYASPYGLDTRPSVAPFLDGALPTRTPGGSGSWLVEDAFPNLSFLDPITMKPEPRSNRLHVVGKEGQIWHFDNDPAVTSKTLFLDISAQVQVTDNAGLVSLAFHPEFGQAGSPNRNYFYVYYYYSPSPYVVTNNDLPNPSYVRLSRFERPDGSATADPSSEYVLVQQWDRHHWHNGGGMLFDDDGFLYLSIGDEGSDFDPYNVGQKLDGGLLNGVMRIDVDQDLSRSHAIRRQPQPGGTPPAGWPASFSQGYTIPNDNPWLDPAGSILEEFWCTGLRSPHSMHRDPVTGDIFVGDVGQGSREEVDKIVKAGNYQWPYREGDIAGPKTKPASIYGTDVEPLHAYPRNEGVCVVVGPVYRGQQHAADLGGKLLFADHEFRKLWTMDPDGDSSSVEFLTNMPPGGFHANIATFAVDHAQELYMVKLQGESNPGGKIYKLGRSGGSVAEPPALLSQLGAFSDLATLAPASGFIPYAPNAPFWSDGATKKRWIAVPDGQQIGYSEEGEWTFPVGTVLMKHFDLFDERLETRFFVHGDNGDWYGVTYKWLADGSDAQLLFSSDTRSITPPAGGAAQQWYFPSRADCMTCHRPEAGSVLGVKTRQLNGDLFYSGNDCTANQLATLNHLGLFDQSLNEASLPNLLTSVPVKDLHFPAEARARSWLDSNCAYCHRPGGVQPDFDLRLTTPLANANIINGALVGPFDVPGAAVVRAQDTMRSILHLRTDSLGELGMPPLAKGTVDEDAVTAITDWINSLDPVANAPAGALGEYYDDRFFNDFVFNRTDPAIDFNWGTGSPDALIHQDNFSIRWTGQLIPAFSENYTFHVLSNNGIRVWIDGEMIIDRFVNNIVITANGSKTLQAGVPVPFTVEYYDVTNAAEVHLEWQSNSQTREVISGDSMMQTASQDGPPIAVYDDAGDLPRSATSVINVLSNDFDYQDNLDSSTVTIVSQPASGSAVAGAGGVVTLTPGTAVGLDSFTYSVADSNGSTSNIALVEFTIESHAESWRLANFPTTIDDPTISAWTADPDNDGQPNAIEYATGSDPNSATSLPATVLSTTTAGIEWQIPKLAGTEAILSIEQSNDLSGWSPTAAPVQILEDSPTQLRVAIDPDLANAKFLRLQVVIPGA